MNNHFVFGQYIYKNSIIHKLDPRVKIISLVLLMIGVFLIPYPSLNVALSFYILAGFGVFLFIVILLTKVSFFQYLKTMKQVIFLLLFALLFQMLINKDNLPPLFSIEFRFSYLNILLSIGLIVLYFIFQKYLRPRILFILLLIVGVCVLLHFPITSQFGAFTASFYQAGVITGSFILFRVFYVLALSSILTLTTKPVDLTSALEWYLKPLEKLHLKPSILAMMLSIALRFIPTLFNETNKILRAQSARGADFGESGLKKQIGQIISLLIPMFVISFQRAEDLADAMEARGYIPGAKRTQLLEMKFNKVDLLSAILVLLVFLAIIALRFI